MNKYLHYRGPKKRADKLFEEIIPEIFSNPVKVTDIHLRNTSSFKQDKPKDTPRHIIIKASKIKDKKRILKAAR